jgi:biopolymer transport protein ExbB
MIPLGLCSVALVAWVLERSLRMRAKAIGDRRTADQLVDAVRDGGPARALEVARASPNTLSRLFQPLFERWDESRPALEKAVEDSASRDLRGLTSSLRPLSVIAVSAPLLGLLGTVIGIIIAFRDIALSNAMGKPEALAVGIAQALITTASGLVVAIPAQIAYYWFRSRIDRFGRLVEDTGERILAVRDGRAPRPGTSTPPAPAVPVPSQVPVLAQVAS